MGPLTEMLSVHIEESPLTAIATSGSMVTIDPSDAVQLLITEVVILREHVLALSSQVDALTVLVEGSA